MSPTFKQGRPENIIVLKPLKKDFEFQKLNGC